MRASDILGLALTTFLRRKLRTSLTLLGIAMGTTLLLLTISGGAGVMRAVERHYEGQEQLRRVSVGIDYDISDRHIPPGDLQIEGDMDEDRRQRLRKAVRKRHPAVRYDAKTPLTPRLVEKFKQLPHVDWIIPGIHLVVEASLDAEPERAVAVGVSRRAPDLEKSIVAGDVFAHESAETILVHEYLAYRWGIRSDAELAQLPGKTVRVVYRQGGGAIASAVGWSSRFGRLLDVAESRALDQALKNLAEAADRLGLTEEQVQAFVKAFGQRADEAAPGAVGETLLSRELVIAGVFRDVEGEGSYDPFRLAIPPSAEILLTVEAARTLSEPIMKATGEEGYNEATIAVDNEAHLQQVVDAVEAEGFSAYSLVNFITNVRERIRFITALLAGLAFVALLVAAIGIANTMSMNVLERTHEIGIFKAVGARDGHVAMVFIAECALLGLVGCALGMLTGWTITLAITEWVRGIVSGEFGREIKEPMFAFPAWLLVGLPLTVVVLTAIAGALPARRASRIDPIAALRA